jgi:hypothetical protein
MGWSRACRLACGGGGPRPSVASAGCGPGAGSTRGEPADCHSEPSTADASTAADVAAGPDPDPATGADADTATASNAPAHTKRSGPQPAGGVGVPDRRISGIDAFPHPILGCSGPTRVGVWELGPRRVGGAEPASQPESGPGRPHRRSPDRYADRRLEPGRARRPAGRAAPRRGRGSPGRRPGWCRVATGDPSIRAADGVLEPARSVAIPPLTDRLPPAQRAPGQADPRKAASAGSNACRSSGRFRPGRPRRIGPSGSPSPSPRSSFRR